jgi:hypothetical protein
MTHAQACASLSGELSRNFGALTLTESHVLHGIAH